MRHIFGVSIVLIILVGVGAILFSEHLSDSTRTVHLTTATTTQQAITLVSLSDSYRRGVHTISGALVVPTPCYAPVAQTTLVPSTTPPEIKLELSVPRDTGICLQLAATTTFRVKQSAARDAIIDAYINGTIATSTGTTTRK